MPKRAPKNSFYFFMEEYKVHQENRGVKFRNGMKDVADAAGPIWKDMTPAQKSVYEQRAKDYKLNLHDMGEKYTSQGVSYAELERRDKDKKKLEDDENAEVDGIIKGTLGSQNIVDEVFYLIDMDLYCITQRKDHVPCEISIAPFRLSEGVISVYHTFISPEIPSGYSFEAKKTAERHGISIPPLDFEAVTDNSVLLAQILDFLDITVTDKPPAFFTMPDQVQKIKCVLQQLCYEANMTMDHFRVYDITKLFFKLKNHLCPYDGQLLPTLALAHAELARDVFDYCEGIGCEIDEKNDTAVVCTKARVKRWAYIICDHCCKLCNIALTPGKHVPVTVDTQRHYNSMTSGSERPGTAMSKSSEWTTVHRRPDSRATESDRGSVQSTAVHRRPDSQASESDYGSVQSTAVHRRPDSQASESDYGSVQSAARGEPSEKSQPRSQVQSSITAGNAWGAVGNLSARLGGVKLESGDAWGPPLPSSSNADDRDASASSNSLRRPKGPPISKTSFKTSISFDKKEGDQPIGSRGRGAASAWNK